MRPIIGFWLLRSPFPRALVALFSAVLTVAVEAQEIRGITAPLRIYPPGFRFTFEPPPKPGAVGTAIRTQDGFLWIGTPEGLARFDGYEFKYYRHPLGISDEKLANSIWELLEDHDGRLWLGSSAGLQEFDRRTGKFTRYLHDPKDTSSLSGDFVRALHVDSKGDFLVGTLGGGMCRFDSQSGTFTRVRAGPGQKAVTSFCEDRNGVTWVGTSGGLARYERETMSLITLAGGGQHSLQLTCDSVSSLHEDRNGNLWVGTLNGVNRIDPTRLHCTKYAPSVAASGLASGAVMSIVEDAFGGIWLNIWRKGIYRYDPKEDAFVHLEHRKSDPDTPVTDDVVRLYAEPESPDPGFTSAIWILYTNQGLGKVVVHQNRFTCFDRIADSLLDAQNWIVKIVVDDLGNPWCVTGNGLYRLNPGSQSFTRYFGGEYGGKVAKHLGQAVWVTKPPYTYRIRGSAGTFVPLMKDTVFVIGESRDGSVWFSSGGVNTHLARLDTASGILRHYERLAADAGPVKDTEVTAFCEDGQGNIWFGTFSGGMSRLDPKSGDYRRYLSRPGDSTALRNNSVRSILEDDSGVLWVGTNGGLLSFDRMSEQFTPYPWPERERDLFIRAMVDDGSGNLWLSGSGSRLVCFTKERGTYRTFGPERGMPVKNTFGMAFDEKRRVIYLGGHGLAAFSPDSLLFADNPTIPRVSITGFKIFDEPADLPCSIAATREIVLAHNENYVSFTFSVLDFMNPSGNRYAYMMEGVDNGWVRSFDRRYAIYTNLDPGAYVFRVKGSNSLGVWNEEGTSVRLMVTPPWWKTTWAYMCYAVVALLTLYGLRRYDRKRAVLKHELRMERFEAEKLHEIDGMKMRFFANISHEFRTPLTLILGPVEKMMARTDRASDQEDLSVVRRNALRLLELVNQLLDISKLDAGKMKVRVQATDLVLFLRGLVFSFASLAERKHVELDFQSSEDDITAYVDRDKLQKIVANLLSNAFKFTPDGGKVRVELSLAAGEPGRDRGHPENTEGRAEIVVSDNGAGIPTEKLEKIFQRFYQADDSPLREHEGTGIGLALTKELVEMHHGNISVASEPGKGTTFRVHLPVGKGQWKEEEIFEDLEDTEGTSFAVPVAIFGHDEDKELGEARGGETELEETSDEDMPLVLIVEDNADVRSYVRSYLTGQYRVGEATDGLAGLEAAIEAMPDLVVSDIMMPTMDGVELCRKLKTDERTSHIPVILLTARASDEGKLEGLETGADDYMIKPFDVKELQVRIRNLIELRRNLRVKYRRQCVLEPQGVPIESMDEKFLRKALDTVQLEMSEPGFGTSALAQRVCMSRTQLYRKLHALTGKTPHEFIRSIRLQRAAKLLEAQWGNVAEVAFEVGFSSLSHFAKAFREEIGVLPSKYVDQHPHRSHQ